MDSVDTRVMRSDRAVGIPGVGQERKIVKRPQGFCQV